MGHLQTFEAELRGRLEEGDVEALVKWVKEQVLASYRNGLATRETASKDGDRFTRPRYSKK
jgi:hypothetical protein